MNLQKLFEMQKKLDAEIERKHPVADGENRLDKKFVALLAELGELTNEIRSFKFWSEDQEPRKNLYSFTGADGYRHSTYIHPDEDNDIEAFLGVNSVVVHSNPLLEETVDVLHFMLSIGNDLGFNNFELWELPNEQDTIESALLELHGKISSLHFMKRTRFVEVDQLAVEIIFAAFNVVTSRLGFTWEEIEQAYMSKNEKNWNRQATGY